MAELRHFVDFLSAPLTKQSVSYVNTFGQMLESTTPVRSWLSLLDDARLRGAFDLIRKYAIGLYPYLEFDAKDKNIWLDLFKATVGVLTEDNFVVSQFFDLWRPRLTSTVKEIGTTMAHWKPGSSVRANFARDLPKYSEEFESWVKWVEMMGMPNMANVRLMLVKLPFLRRFGINTTEVVGHFERDVGIWNYLAGLGWGWKQVRRFERAMIIMRTGSLTAACDPFWPGIHEWVLSMAELFMKIETKSSISVGDVGRIIDAYRVFSGKK
jgi:hypothetical protein